MSTRHCGAFAGWAKNDTGRRRRPVSSGTSVSDLTHDDPQSPRLVKAVFPSSRRRQNCLKLRADPCLQRGISARSRQDVARPCRSRNGGQDEDPFRITRNGSRRGSPGARPRRRARRGTGRGVPVPQGLLGMPHHGTRQEPSRTEPRRYRRAKAGTVSGFAYSESNKTSNVVWDDATPGQVLGDPKGFMPGTKMLYAGMKSPDDRKALIEYMRAAK